MPSVYVYEVAHLLTPPDSSFGVGPRWLDELRRDPPFGGLVSAEHGFHMTDMFSFGSILTHRLLTHANLVTDPAEADLLFVPTWPSFRYRRSSDCRAFAEFNLNGTGLDRHLPHLTDGNAHRHVLFVSAEHFGYSDCTGWFSSPRGLLRRAQRLALSPLIPTSITPDLAYMAWGAERFADATNGDAYPNLHSMPHPTGVHWSPRYATPPPWTLRRPRAVFMNWIGDASHGDVRVRRRLVKECDSFNDRLACTRHAGFWDSYAARVVLSKGDSTFCLEPAGDTPFRKSVADSITFGCIPVFFHNATDYTSTLLAPPNGSSGACGIRNLRVMIDRATYLAGAADVRVLLSAVPPRVVRQKQRAIARCGGRWQMSLTDDAGDAFSAMLDALQARARRAEGSDAALPPSPPLSPPDTPGPLSPPWAPPRRRSRSSRARQAAGQAGRGAAARGARA